MLLSYLLTYLQARGGAKQRDALFTSWHRYSDFRALNDSVAEELGLPSTFPVAKAPYSVHLVPLVYLLGAHVCRLPRCQGALVHLLNISYYI